VQKGGRREMSEEETEKSFEARDNVTDALLLLISELIDRDLVDIARLKNLVGEYDIMKIRFSKRFDYKRVAEMLKDTGTVFLPVSPKRAYYCQSRLEEILGKYVDKEKATWDNERGYIYYYQPKPQKKLVEVTKNA
jgi:hypothetical protein